MIAIEAKYHHDCLHRLYNRGRKVVHKSNDEDDSCLHGIAFAELVAFLEGTNSDDSAAVFKLTDIAQMYKTRVEQLGGIVATCIHTTRLNNRLLSVLPDLRAYLKGRDTLLSFEKNVGEALITACTHDDEAMHLMRAANVVQKDIFNSNFVFDGSFKENCQQQSVLPSLLALVNMVLDRANVEDYTGRKVGFAKKLHVVQILCKLIELNLLLVCRVAIPLFASLGFPTNLHICLHMCKFNTKFALNLRMGKLDANLVQICKHFAHIHLLSLQLVGLP